MKKMERYSRVLDFFSGLLKKDPELYTRINAATSNIYFKQREVVFDLPSLHTFIFIPEEVSFIEFKKLLYGSDLNKQLTAEGGKVVLIDNKGNVNESLYGFKRALKD